jgi:hypothetical protein
MTAMFVNGSKRNEQSHRRASIDASYQVSVGRFLKIFFETVCQNEPKFGGKHL